MIANKSIFSNSDWQKQAAGKFLVYRGKFLNENLNLGAVRRYVREQGALGALWTYDYGLTQCGPWYRCICSTPDYDIGKIENKKGRYYVRRGLQRCSVQPVSYEWLSNNGYDVYLNACVRYTNFTPSSPENFRKAMIDNSREPGREALGVFTDNKLAAYATLQISGDTVRIYGSQFDPAYSQSYPMYALYYTIAHHYLKERHCKEIDNGCRALLHDTQIEVFLQRLGWRKDYCRLGLYLRPSVRAVLFVAWLFRKPLRWLLPSRFYVILQSLLDAEDIAKATKEG